MLVYAAQDSPEFRCAAVAGPGRYPEGTVNSGIVDYILVIEDDEDLRLSMQSVLASFDPGVPDAPQLKIRIGINSGPVVAGVIGIRKFIYDLWGDTVNVASRMESHGIPGQIQVSEATHAMLRNDFVFEPRGAIPIKGKGEMNVFLLKRPRTPIPARIAA